MWKRKRLKNQKLSRVKKKIKTLKAVGKSTEFMAYGHYIKHKNFEYCDFFNVNKNMFN